MSLQKIEVNSFQDRIEWLWDQVKSQDYYFDDMTRGDYTFLLRLLFSENSEHFYNQSGMVSVINIQPKVNADIHFMLWDMKYPVRKVIEEAKLLFSDLFQRYELSRLTATIPANNKGAIRLATLLGMRFEGSMKEAFLFKEHYYDLFFYGVLRREFEREERTN